MSDIIARRAVAPAVNPRIFEKAALCDHFVELLLGAVKIGDTLLLTLATLARRPGNGEHHAFVLLDELLANGALADAAGAGYDDQLSLIHRSPPL